LATHEARRNRDDSLIRRKGGGKAKGAMIEKRNQARIKKQNISHQVGRKKRAKRLRPRRRSETEM